MPATRPARAPRPQSCPRWRNAATSAASATEQTTDSSGCAHWRKAREAAGGIEDRDEESARPPCALVGAPGPGREGFSAAIHDPFSRRTARARRRAGRVFERWPEPRRGAPRSCMRAASPRLRDAAGRAPRPRNDPARASSAISSGRGSSSGRASSASPIVSSRRRRSRCLAVRICQAAMPRIHGSASRLESKAEARANTRMSASCAASSASAGRRCRPTNPRTSGQTSAYTSSKALRLPSASSAILSWRSFRSPGSMSRA